MYHPVLGNLLKPVCIIQVCTYCYFGGGDYPIRGETFFHNLLPGRTDTVKCYICGGEMCGWCPWNDPKVQHAILFPRCVHVQSNEIPSPPASVINKLEAVDELNGAANMDMPKETVPGNYRSLCAICLKKESSVVILPCSHYCACLECASQALAMLFPECPICKSHIKSFIEVYVS